MDDLSKSEKEANLGGKNSSMLQKDEKYINLERKAVRKSDLVIISTLTIFSFLSHLDRANLGNARAAGLQEVLQINDYQFSIALTITFVPYIAAEIPVNLLLKKVGANIMIPLLVTLWGLVTTFQGFVRTYKFLLLSRFLLGAVEGGLYPATVLYVSNFYKRSELQIRIAIFSSSVALSGAIAGVLAYGLIQMDGIGNIPGWGWIFIVEGIFTTICGIGGFFVFPLSPSQCQFLTLEERDIMKLRLEKDSFDTISSKEENFSWKQILQAFKSPHVILVSAALFMTGVNIYGLAYFQPSIIRSLGFKGKMIQLISVPPFAVGFISMISTSYASDRYRSRGVTATLCSAVAFIGYALFYTQSSNSVRYGSIFLSTAGVYSVSPTLYAWIANNSMPHYRKATAIALGPVAANSGGILSTWLFPTSAEPQYRLATIINMSFSAGTLALCCVNLIWLKNRNNKKKTLRDKKTQILESDSLGSFHSEKKHNLSRKISSPKGDDHPDFIYAY